MALMRQMHVMFVKKEHLGDNGFDIRPFVFGSMKNVLQIVQNFPVVIHDLLRNYKWQKDAIWRKSNVTADV